ncbi:hypothetical protein D3C72_1893160 [compost metagenome]
MLREVQLEAATSPEDRHAQARMKEMYGLILLVTTWFGDMQRLDVATLEKLMRLGSRVTKLLDVKDRFASAIGMGGDKSTDAAPKKAPKTPAKSSRPRKE